MLLRLLNSYYYICLFVHFYMRYHLVLKKFDFDIEVLRKKIIKLDYAVISDALGSWGWIAEGEGDGNALLQLSEVDQAWKEECSRRFKQELLRQDVIALGKKLGKISLKIKTYPGVNIPASILKKKLLKPLHYAGVQVKETSSPVLIELHQDKGVHYHILTLVTNEQPSRGEKARHQHLAVLLEHPRLVDEVADVLRICLIFGLKLYVIHHQPREFQRLLNAAKKITKGKLADFPVKIVSSVRDAGDYGRIGFSKHAKKTEKDLLEFFEYAAHQRVLLVFGNDTFGLSQKTRDELHVLFHLTPDYQKPLKANQALAYVLGMCTAIRHE